MDALLSFDSLLQYLPPYTTLRLLGTSTPLEVTGCLGRKRSTSPLVEGKRKKSRGNSLAELDSDDYIVHYPRQASTGVFIRQTASLSSGRGVVLASSSQSAPKLPREAKGVGPPPTNP